MDMLNAKINFIDLNGEDLVINSNTQIKYTNHSHPNTATSYRVETNNQSIVYTTDCEHPVKNLNKNVIEIAKNSDMLIHDSHFSNEDLEKFKGWGHSSYGEAIDVANKANVKTLVLFHYSPNYNDDEVYRIEKEAKKTFKNNIASKQGLKINF